MAQPSDEAMDEGVLNILKNNARNDLIASENQPDGYRGKEAKLWLRAREYEQALVTANRLEAVVKSLHILAVISKEHFEATTGKTLDTVITGDLDSLKDNV